VFGLAASSIWSRLTVPVMYHVRVVAEISIHLGLSLPASFMDVVARNVGLSK